jgi:DNA polymerase-3 subunit epsilon
VGRADTVREYPRRGRLNMHWRDCEYVVLDLETTGLDLARDHIISWGAVPVIQGRVVMGEGIYSLVKSEKPPSPESVRFHLLREQDLKGAPPEAEALGRLLHVLEGRVLVAHAAWIERAFMTRAMGAQHLRRFPPVIDTAALARAAGLVDRAAEREPDLEELCTRLGLPVVEPHHALGDAVTAAGLFVMAASLLEARGERTARDLLDVSECHSLSP